MLPLTIFCGIILGAIFDGVTDEDEGPGETMHPDTHARITAYWADIFKH